MFHSFKLILIFVLVLQSTTVPVTAQNKFTIIFYNVENLFDTRDDPLTSDEEFTPSGERHWTRQRFEDKLKMIYKALITAGKGEFPDIIGVAEVENRWVVEQLIYQTPLNKVPYGIIHKESPDPRGIDVALLYRKDRIIPIDFSFIPVSNYGENPFQSRDILLFTAQLGGEQIHCFVNHWPSRSGGYVETREKRNIAARILRYHVDSLISKDHEARILIMGDFNATSNEKCFTSILKAFPYPGNNKPIFLVNLSTLWTNRAQGTIRNAGQWEVFDQIICTRNLLNNKPLNILTNESGIGNYNFLLEPDHTYLGNKPFRTYMGPVYHGGVSDHLPVIINISADK